MSPPTEVAGRYLIERRLGAGGMSTVFKARDTVLERPVAVKLLAEHLADDEAFVYRFRRDEQGEVDGSTADAGAELDLSAGRWLINPGGVGQPRDGDPRAAWLLLDTSTWTAEWRRVEYPIDEAARAIEDAGLPRILAERLYSGQ